MDIRKWWKRRAVRIATAALAGAAVGASCGLLPERFHALCHAAAKLIHLLGGL
jgi:hypothetical protein